MKQFILRVYGILLNEKGEFLICDEVYQNKQMTKFPGGGLEWGEGLADALHREFIEELNVEIEVVKHLYTTDFFQPSAFNQEHQLISVYFQVKPLYKIDWNQTFDFARSQGIGCRFLEKLSESDLTWPIDKLIIKMINENRLQFEI